MTPTDTINALEKALEALRIARDFMSIASDWNIDEAEIDGEMRSTYDWLEIVTAAHDAARSALDDNTKGAAPELADLGINGSRCGTHGTSGS